MKNLSSKRLFALIALVAFPLAGQARAGDRSLVIDDKSPEDFCRENPSWCDIFEKATLYQDEDARLIQRFSLRGRYHGQFMSQSLDYSRLGSGGDLPWSDAGGHHWEHRRFRLGLKVDFLNDFSFFANGNIAANRQLTQGHFLDDIDHMFISWKPSDASIGGLDGLYVNIGKHKQMITREFTESSLFIITVERSHISNEVIAGFGRPWGVSIGFELCDLDHELGFWLGGLENSNGFGGNSIEGPLWPSADGRSSLTYRAAKEINDVTTVFFDYAFTNNDGGAQPPQGLHSDATQLSDYEHIIALGTHSEWDLGQCDRKAGLITDAIWGLNKESDAGEEEFPGNATPVGFDTFGFVFLPYYDLTERLQLVGRYAYASESELHRSQRETSITAPGVAGPTDGQFRPNLSDVHTFYLGLTHHFCERKLKLMAGYEYLSADVFSGEAIDNGSVTGDSWMFAVRTYW